MYQIQRINCYLRFSTWIFGRSINVRITSQKNPESNATASQNNFGMFGYIATGKIDYKECLLSGRNRDWQDAGVVTTPWRRISGGRGFGYSQPQNPNRAQSCFYDLCNSELVTRFPTETAELLVYLSSCTFGYNANDLIKIEMRLPLYLHMFVVASMRHLPTQV